MFFVVRNQIHFRLCIDEAVHSHVGIHCNYKILQSSTVAVAYINGFTVSGLYSEGTLTPMLMVTNLANTK